MSIIAGYVRKEGRFSDELIKEKIKSIVTKDFTTDMNLMGSLATFCYSYRYLNKEC